MDPGSDGSGSDSDGGVCGSVARVVRESEGLGAWGLGGDEASGKVLESCRDDDGMVAISFSPTVFLLLDKNSNSYLMSFRYFIFYFYVRNAYLVVGSLWAVNNTPYK